MTNNPLFYNLRYRQICQWNQFSLKAFSIKKETVQFSLNINRVIKLTVDYLNIAKNNNSFGMNNGIHNL